MPKRVTPESGHGQTVFVEFLNMEVPNVEASGDKPLHYIIQNLERAYGTPVNSCPTDPLAMLVQIILLKPRAT
jgi:hypothetical protein